MGPGFARKIYPRVCTLKPRENKLNKRWGRYKTGELKGMDETSMGSKEKRYLREGGQKGENLAEREGEGRQTHVGKAAMHT